MIRKGRFVRGRVVVAAVAASVAMAAAGCGATGAVEAPVSAVVHGESPAGEGSLAPNLFAAEDGRVYMSWLEPIGEGVHELRFASWEAGVWTAPAVIRASSDFWVNWADFPSLVALPDGRLAVHWLQRSGPGTYDYDVRVSMSGDGGRSWSESVVPHRDGTLSEHGFVSLFPWRGGGLAAVWLDGRDFANRDATAEGAGPEMTLRKTVIGADGTLSEEVLLDGRVCDCCQTAAALTSAGPVVAYRDRSPEEVRDISIVRHVAGRWTEPAPVHDDGWVIPACPVNGPAIAADGARVVAAWFTAADDSPRVLAAFSEDAGASFGRPVRVDDGDPSGRVAVVLPPGGGALVSWLERTGDGADVRVRHVRPGGRGPAVVVAASSAARASGFPRMALSGDRLVFAWTEPEQPPRVRVATANLEIGS